MLKINLLPPKVRKSKIALRFYTYLIMAASLVAILLILVLLNLAAQIRSMQKTLASFDQEMTAMTDKVKPFQTLLRQEGELEQYYALLAKLVRKQPTWIIILDELADRVSRDLWLTRLLSQPRKVDQVFLTLEGEAYHKISVADFLTALEDSSRFQDVKLEVLNEVKQSQSTHVRFKVTLLYIGKSLAPGGSP